MLIQEADGSVTRCGYARSVAAFDLAPDAPKPPAPRVPRLVARTMVAALMGLLGVAIALDWLAFVLYVSRNDADPQLASAFVVRVGASIAYGLAATWLWRHR